MSLYQSKVFTFAASDSWLYAVRRCSVEGEAIIGDIAISDSWLYAVRRCSRFQTIDHDEAQEVIRGFMPLGVAQFQKRAESPPLTQRDSWLHAVRRCSKYEEVYSERLLSL